MSELAIYACFINIDDKLAWFTPLADARPTLHLDTLTSHTEQCSAKRVYVIYTHTVLFDSHISSLQLSYRIYVSRSHKIKIMTAALTRSSNVETFQFSASHAENCPSVGDVLISGGRLFHANEPATEKLRGPKPVVLVRGTTRSPWPAEHKWRRVETAETGLIIDTRYGATSWWRHLYTRIQILKSIRCRTRSQWRLSRMVGGI